MIPQPNNIVRHSPPLDLRASRDRDATVTVPPAVIRLSPKNRFRAATCTSREQSDRQRQNYNHLSSSLFVVLSGGLSCVLYRPVRGWERGKSSVRFVEPPTHLSATCFLTSQKRCSGRKTLRQISRQRAAAACERRNGISGVIANGPARRSRRWSLKSSDVIRCAMSV